MTVLIENVFPVGVTHQLLDAVTDEMGVDARTPTRWDRARALREGRTCSRRRPMGLSRGLSAVCPVDARASHGQGATARGLDPSKMGEPGVTEVHRIVR
jgi:hypothetical protein